MIHKFAVDSITSLHHLLPNGRINGSKASYAYGQVRMN